MTRDDSGTTSTDRERERLRMVERQLSRRGIEDERVLRAMATVPRSLRSLLAASFLIGGRVAFSFMVASMPPPWIMNRGMTRWKIVPS